MTGKTALFLFLSFTGYLLAQNPMKAPIKIEEEVNNNRFDVSNVYKFYKTYISPADGDRCLMYPSCSTYAKQAITKFGFLRGFMMTTDRLTRCGIDLHQYSQFINNGKVYSIDPVANKRGNED